MLNFENGCAQRTKKNLAIGDRTSEVFSLPQYFIMVVHNDENIIDLLLESNLFHLVEDIFLRLDCQSLTNAETASPRKWSPFIQSNRRLYHKKMATISRWLFITLRPNAKKSLGTTTSHGRGCYNRHRLLVPFEDDPDERDQ